MVSTGLYQIVRHPIYMGYLVTHVAFLVASPSLWNIVALVAADAALLARAVCEEQTLAQDPAYREYQTRVRWRVAPGVSASATCDVLRAVLVRACRALARKREGGCPLESGSARGSDRRLPRPAYLRAA